jgi:hypothetical protein
MVQLAYMVNKEVVVNILAYDIRMLHIVDPYKKKGFCHRLWLDLHMLLYHSTFLQLVEADKVLLVYMESNMDLQKVLG